MLNAARGLMGLVPLFLIGSSLTGCGYFRAQGNDALDMFDVGVSVTTHLMPELACYVDQCDPNRILFAQ